MGTVSLTQKEIIFWKGRNFNFEKHIVCNFRTNGLDLENSLGDQQRRFLVRMLKTRPPISVENLFTYGDRICLFEMDSNSEDSDSYSDSDVEECLNEFGEGVDSDWEIGDWSFD